MCGYTTKKGLRVSCLRLIYGKSWVWSLQYDKCIVNLTGKHRVAHKPNSKPKEEYVIQQEEEEEEKHENEENINGVLTEEELWARLDELERLEEEQDERDR